MVQPDFMKLISGIVPHGLVSNGVSLIGLSFVLGVVGWLFLVGSIKNSNGKYK